MKLALCIVLLLGLLTLARPLEDLHQRAPPIAKGKTLPTNGQKSPAQAQNSQKLPGGCTCPPGQKPTPKGPVAQQSTGKKPATQKAVPEKKKRSFGSESLASRDVALSRRNVIHVYHGTCADDVESIRTNGLRLTYQTRGGDYIYAGMGAAYLTDSLESGRAFVNSVHMRGKCGRRYAVIEFGLQSTGLNIRQFTREEQERYRINGQGGTNGQYEAIRDEIVEWGQVPVRAVPGRTQPGVVGPRFDVLVGTMDTRVDERFAGMPNDFTQYVILTPTAVGHLTFIGSTPVNAQDQAQAHTEDPQAGCRCIIV